MKNSFFLVTLGCAKNEVDSDRMRALLLHAGYHEVTSPSDADVALINTCSFLVSATSESIEATLELAETRAEGTRTRPIIMCGCVPSRYGDELIPELPEIAAFVRADEEDGIVSVVQSILEKDNNNKTHEAATDSVLRTIEGASAYVKISEGCDRFCTFCAIPYIRGRYYSRSSQDICEEVAHLAQSGVREIILIGQDTGIWGSDFDTKESLADLLKRLADIMRPYKGWIRVLYLQPEGMTDELIATIRDTPEVLPYIDIPIQHCNHDVLKAMGRSGSREELASLFKKLREQIPGVVLRTTGMCGFPGESDDDADELLEFVTAQEFDYLSVFSYSAEEGTRASRLPNQIDEDIKLERTQRLIDVAESLGFAASAKHVGEIVDVIIDGVEMAPDGAEFIGHTWFQAPDCDGVVHISEGSVAVGDIVPCKIIDSVCYELYGEIVE